MPKVRIKSYVHSTEWDSFVRSQRKGTIFHTAAMCRTFARTKGYEVHAMAAYDAGGCIRAILAAVLVSTSRALGSLGARSLLFAQPLCTEDKMGTEALVELVRHHDETMQGRSLFTEVRPLFESGPERAVLAACGYDWLPYRNYELNLSVSSEQLWKQIDPQCRRDIRRAVRRGVVIRDGNLVSDLEVVYGHLQQSYGRARVPLVDKSLFASVCEQLPPEQIAVTISEYQGRPVASACNLIYGGRVYFWYSGVVRIPGIAANACLVWDAIQRAKASGQQIFDFGGAGWANQEYGPGRFKSRFGGRLVKHGRYRRVHSAWTLRMADSAYRWGRWFLAPAQPFTPSGQPRGAQHAI